MPETLLAIYNDMAAILAHLVCSVLILRSKFGDDYLKAYIESKKNNTLYKPTFIQPQFT